MNQTSPARTLAKGRSKANWLAIALMVSVLFNIGTPIYYSLQARSKDKVVVLDLASGSLLLSPLVDPGDSKDILSVITSWAAKAILDRNPAGLDNEELIGILFNSETSRKIRDEFASLKTQYVQKNLRSHVEIKSIDSQGIGNGIIKATVSGQVILTGTVHGTAIQQVQPVTLELSLARNPDLGRNKRYPLMCFGYSYSEGGASLAKQ
jgi:hypothetical protein